MITLTAAKFSDESFAAVNIDARSALRPSGRRHGHRHPKAIIHKIFDPFFTTKKSAGDGMGWHVDGIVRPRSLRA